MNNEPADDEVQIMRTVKKFLLIGVLSLLGLVAWAWDLVNRKS